MAKTIKLDIVTPEKIAYAGEVNMIIARTTNGDVGIMPGHAPLIAGLAIWPLRLVVEEQEEKIALAGGFLEVQPDKITILTPSSELPEEIDIARAQSAKARAENRLSGKAVDIDMLRAETALQRALTRLQVSEQRKKV